RTLLRSEKNYPLWIDGDEYLLPDRQRIQRRAAGYEPLIAAKHVHLGEIALENRLLDPRQPHVALAGGPLRRNLQMYGAHRHSELITYGTAVGGPVDHLPARRLKCEQTILREIAAIAATHQIGGADEISNKGTTWEAIDFVGRTDLLDQPITHHHDTVRHRQSLFEVVGHIDRRDAEPVL